MREYGGPLVWARLSVVQRGELLAHEIEKSLRSAWQMEQAGKGGGKPKLGTTGGMNAELAALQGRFFGS
jgi:hypothetical protein